VNAPQGLFPRPWHPETDASSNKKYGKVLEHFRLLGRVMAKALQDGRLLDVPLSTALYKIVLGQASDWGVSVVRGLRGCVAMCLV
jgi:E3 ubiquitin-protein ligase TRIP12